MTNTRAVHCKMLLRERDVAYDFYSKLHTLPGILIDSNLTFSMFNMFYAVANCVDLF